MEIKIDWKFIPVVEIDTFKKRLFGYMGKKEISDIYFFPKCRSIHTFFMRQPIDIIMTDADYHIIKTYENVKPWQVICPKKKFNIVNTFECPIGTIAKLPQKNYLEIR